MEITNSNPQNFNEVFIVDKGIVNDFFKDEKYETAELFFNYLTTHCKYNKAYIIPSLFDEIHKKIEEELKNSEERKTEIISYLNNWIEKADLLGADKGDEELDMTLLYKFLSLLYPDSEIIIISNKLFKDDNLKVLPINKISAYLMGNQKFREYLKVTYGLNDGASY